MTETQAITTEAELDAAMSADYDRLAAELEPELKEPVEEPKEAAPEPEAEEAPTEEIPDQPEEVIPAPVGWSEEDRAHFATLPPDVQKVVLRRESERDKALGQKSQEFADTKRRLEALDEVLQPHRQSWELNGISEAQAISRLLAAQKLLSERPADGIAYLARQYGVNLPGNTAQQPSGLDPNIQKRLDKIESSMHQTAQQQKQAQTSAIERTIQSWASETDDKGQPLRPHFEAVQDLMTANLATIRAQNPGLSHADMLSRAYDMAVWAHPDVRGTLIDAQKRSEQAKRAAEARHKAEKAQKAAASVSSDGGSGKPGKMDIDEAMEAAWAQLS